MTHFRINLYLFHSFYGVLTVLALYMFLYLLCKLVSFSLCICLMNLLIFLPDMLNHSFQPNCFFHWHFKDRMLEVMINAGQRIKKGDPVMLFMLIKY
jgi:hypothetical protein